MASFNLLDQPWIPCLTPEGERCELGIEEALVSAHKLAGIEGESPIEMAALHRLLLAILHRVFGPKDYAAWKKLWEKRSFDERKLKAYLRSNKCADRFDLFDEERPLYQVAGLDVSERGVSTTRFCLETPTGAASGALLFGHTADEPRPQLTPADAARRLLAFQCFATGGFVSDESPAGKTSAKAAPFAGAAMMMLRGKELFQTLLLNLHLYCPEDEVPFPAHGVDQPAWERDAAAVCGVRRPAGYMDLLTWQSRRILLSRGEQNSRTVVDTVVIMDGERFPKKYTLHKREPMMAFRKRIKAKPNEDPWPGVRLEEEKALWRNSTALLQSVRGTRSRPMMLDQISDLVEEGILPAGATLPVDVLGEATDKKKIEFWRNETLHLPVTYLKKSRLVVALSGALSDAEKGGVALAFAANELGAYATSAKGWGKLSGKAKGTARGLADSLAPHRHYWPRLETPFKELMIALPEDRSVVDGEPEYGEKRLPEWRALVVRTAQQAFDEATRGLQGSPRTLRAVARGQRELNKQLAELTKSSGEEGGES